MPPYSSGKGSPNRPISAMPATTSYGKLCSRSCRAETGATTCSAKSRTVAASSRYSSGSSDGIDSGMIGSSVNDR